MSATVRRLVTFALAATAALAFAAPAGAGVLVASAPNCSDAAWENPFTPWNDLANYVLAPGGTAESAAGWTFSSGAGIGAGNESYNVHGLGETSSVALADGATATTGTMCVGLEHPTLRFFVRQTAGPLAGHVDVSVNMEDNDGNVVNVPLGVAPASSTWQPSPIYVVSASLLPLLPGSHTPVQFVFTAHNGSVAIDDVYVDPYVKY